MSPFDLSFFYETLRSFIVILAVAALAFDPDEANQQSQTWSTQPQISGYTLALYGRLSLERRRNHPHLQVDFASHTKTW
jgi:hypothetical protein